MKNEEFADLTGGEKVVLDWYRKETFSMDMNKVGYRESLVEKGYIEWAGYTGWSGVNQYKLTEKGRRYRGFE